MKPTLKLGIALLTGWAPALPVDAQQVDPSEKAPRVGPPATKATPGVSEWTVTVPDGTPIPGVIPCEDIRRFKAWCEPSGEAHAKLKLKTDAHHGETVTFAFTGQPVEARVRGKKARGYFCCFNASTVISLEDPPNCVKPVRRFCA